MCLIVYDLELSTIRLLRPELGCCVTVKKRLNDGFQYSEFHETYEGKADPLEARCGPKGSRRFRLPDFMTFGT